MVIVFRALAASLGWFAVVLQYWLVMTGDIGPDPVNRTINFFSYFTILTNILAALAMTVPLIAPNSSLGAFLDRPSVRTAIVTYIIVVAVTYHLILRDLWNPQGWQWVADMSLHYVTPALFALDWLLSVPKRQLAWKGALSALAYPLIYMAWTGVWSGFYPYPFVDVSQIGLEKTLVNAGGMTVAILVLGLLLIALGRGLGLVTGPRTTGQARRPFS